ncbi:phosphate acyltransferase [uncultured Bacteroides sp.]|uniref:phosphate acyltransferase n=1 Tax=uncultured Bacteroides sp. TaxID=162156 RepID=UPI00260BC0E3|nr:phosphate acyltransferase [uncultured Bacteroides sp.]
MEPFRTLSQMVNSLRSRNYRRRVAVVCPNDPHTEYVVIRSLREEIAEFLLVVDDGHQELARHLQAASPNYVRIYKSETPDEAAAMAVQLVRTGEADILMKGLINTDNLLRAVLNKEHGLLPPGGILSHVAMAQIPLYHKLLFFSDAAVIPRPTLEQYRAMIRHDVGLCHKLGCSEPRVALIHCSEKVNEKFPHTLSYVQLMDEARQGAFGPMFMDGPMDAKTACDKHSGEIKGLSSPVVGNTDIMIFPNIEAGNIFYKTITLFGDANTAGMLTGTIAPVVVPSRSDSGNSKYYSLVLACLAGTQND